MRNIRLGPGWYRRRAALVAVPALLVVLLVAVTGLVVRDGLTGSGAPPARTPADPSGSVPGTAPATGPTTPTAGPAATATSAPTTVPGRTGPGRIPGRIPDRAFFELPSRNQHGVEPRFQDGPVLPPLCDRRLPADDMVEHRRSRHLVYVRQPQPANVVPDGSMDQSITSFRPAAAHSWLRQLSQAVTACPEQVIGGIRHRQRLLGDAGYGDEDVLIELTTVERDADGDPVDGEVRHLLRAVRVGDVVTVLWDHGWEGTATDQRLLDDLTVRAVRAIRDWLDG